MAKRKGERPNFNFSRGINTDASYTSFPLNFTSDEENFEILPDGSRRRRRGLIAEARSEAVPYYDSTYVYRQFKWPNANGNPDANFILVQAGPSIYIYRDIFPITDNSIAAVAISQLALETADLTTEVYASPLQMVAGDGVLIVVGKYIHPHYIKYNDADEEFSYFKIDIKERDFAGVEDGFVDTYGPTASEVTSAFQYNLINSGWTSGNISQYVTDTGKYPNKTMVASLAYRRTTAAGYYDEDGLKEYSTDKLLAEIFTDARAPMGHVIKDAFDTDTIEVVTDATATIVATRTSSFGPSTTSVSFEYTGHGLSTGDLITIPDQPITTNGQGTYVHFQRTWYPYGTSRPPRTDYASINIAGTYEVTVADADNFTITLPDNITGVAVSYSVRSAFTSSLILIPTHYSASSGLGEVCPYRPTTCAWFAGRAWFAGIDYSSWSGKIYYTQVVQSTSQYSKCYQSADPTNTDISELVDSDGGVFNIPEAGKIYTLLPYAASLLVFAENGVWQIGPGERGIFTATAYSIKKIKDAGCSGAFSVVLADGTPFYFGKSSIYAVTTDARTGAAVVVNVSEGVIDNLYQSISLDSKGEACAVYDDLHKRILWSLNVPEGGTAYADNIFNLLLVYDLKFKAFTKWRIYVSPYIAPVLLFSHRNIDVSESYNKLNVLATQRSHISQSNFPGLYIFNNSTDFKDNYGPRTVDSTPDLAVELPAYMVTGYDTAGSPEKYKYAPLIHTFMKKTETGFTETGSIGESSLAMQARWDWSDNTSAGKWGTSQECYRHRRLYTATSPTDAYDDGQPLIVARNKVRGRGRSLHLKFTAGTGKDAHIVGWATNFDILTED